MVRKVTPKVQMMSTVTRRRKTRKIKMRPRRLVPLDNLWPGNPSSLGNSRSNSQDSNLSRKPKLWLPYLMISSRTTKLLLNWELK